MKNSEIFELSNALQSKSLKQIETFKVNYAIEKNKRILSKEVDLIRDLVKQVEGYADYIEKAEKLKASATEDKLEEFTKSAKELEEEYKDAISKVQEILDSESGVKLYTIKIEEFPEKLSADNTAILFNILE